MNKILFAAIGFIFLWLAFFAWSEMRTTEAEVPTLSGMPIEVTPPDPIDEKIAAMSLEEKVGQLFILGHWSKMSAASTTERIEKYHLGGVILMDAGSEPEAQLPAQIAAWQAAGTIPLFIGIDQEGGVVSRLKEAPHTQIAQPSIITAVQAYEVGLTRSSALATLGINLNFAPVLEKSVLPESFLYNRVFRNPDNIALLGSSLINGQLAGGVLSSAKHYPGHADTADDSHSVLPTLALSIEEYIRHTKPFTDTIASTDIPLLMTAHVLVPALDPVYPATLSKAIIADLRERVEFKGIVITDDMIMKAVTTNWTSAEASVIALNAGVDMLLFAAEPEAGETAIEAVVQAVEDKIIPMNRVDEALRRVLEAKEMLR